MIVEKDRMNAASLVLKGLSGPRSWYSLPAKASMRRSMHWASPGRRKWPRKCLRALSKLEWTPVKSKVLTYSLKTSAWNGYSSGGPLLRYSPT